MVINAKPCLLSARPLHSPATRDTLFPIRICKRSDRKANGERRRRKKGRKEKKEADRHRRDDGFQGVPGIYFYPSYMHETQNRRTHASKHRTPSRHCHDAAAWRAKKEENARGVTRASERLTGRIQNARAVTRLARVSCRFGKSIARTWRYRSITIVDRDTTGPFARASDRGSIFVQQNSTDM